MSIRANAFSCDITPQDQVQLAGSCGKARISTGTRDKLLASAVHIRGGSGGVIVISLDLQCLDSEFARSVRRKIVAATGTREQNVFVGTTRNHSGPFASAPLYRFGDTSFSEPDQAYLSFVEEQAVQAAAESAVASRPAALASVQLTEPNTGMVVVQDTLSGRISALIVAGAVVPRSLGDENTKVSSDFLHEVRIKVGSGIGCEPVLAYFVTSSVERHSGTDAPAGVPGEELVAKTADKLAGEIVSKIKALTPADFSAREEVSGKILPVHGLKRKALPDIVGAGLMHETARKALTKAEAAQGDLRMARWAEIEAGYAVNFLVARQSERLLEAIEECDPVELQVMNLGKTRLLGLPWVSFPEIGQQLADIGGGRVFIAECTNGDLQGSVMLPDPSKAGSHGLLSPLFDLDNGEALFNAARSLVVPPAPRPAPALAGGLR